MNADGGRVHDLLGTRCDLYVNRMLTGEDFDFHSNLVRAVLPYGLTEFDVHDVHDVHDVFPYTGLNNADQYFMKDCPARPGDHFEFFAEADLLCALSTCPGGDLSVPLWGPDARDPLDVCRPFGIEVYRPNPALLDGWTPTSQGRLPQPPRPAPPRAHRGHRLNRHRAMGRARGCGECAGVAVLAAEPEFL